MAHDEFAMTPDDIKQKLFDTGHFFSPEALVVELVKEEDLPKLTLEDPVVVAAVKSYQEYFKDDLDELTFRGVAFGGFHRESIPDGEVGPNTEILLSKVRCGVPEFLHPEAQEPANWPIACRNEITTSYKMNLPGVNAEQLQAIWLEGDGNWEKELDLKFVLRLQDYPNTRIFAFAQNLSGSVLADQYLATGDCGTRLQGRFDVRSWSTLLLLATVTHEHGHALGLGHLQDSNAIMYPSIHQAGMARRGAPNNTDIAAMLQLGYKRRTAPPIPPIPPTDPTMYRVVLESAAPITVGT